MSKSERQTDLTVDLGQGINLNEARTLLAQIIDESGIKCSIESSYLDTGHGAIVLSVYVQKAEEVACLRGKWELALKNRHPKSRPINH